jgi:hypothetical protein
MEATMPYYTVICKYPEWRREYNYTGVIANDTEQAIKHVTNTYGRNILILRVVEDKHYLKRLETHKLWHKRWVAALRNTPARKGADKGSLTTLGRLVGYKCKGVHLLISANINRGSKPRDPQIAERLLKLAGPYGSIIAWHHLCKTGQQDKFIRPYSTD